jgi:hypothetical protein
MLCAEGLTEGIYQAEALMRFAIRACNQVACLFARDMPEYVAILVIRVPFALLRLV